MAEDEALAPNGSRTAGSALDRRTLAPLVVLAFAQDAIYALVFLSFMNHYLLGVLKASAALPAYTLALYGAARLVTHPLAGKLIDATSARLVLRLSIVAQLLAVGLLLAVQSLAAFLIAAVLLAVGYASIWPLIYETLARTQPSETHSKAAGTLAIVGYIATGFGFLCGVLIGRLVHRSAPFLLTGALVALAGLTQGSRAFAASPGVAPGPGADMDGAPAGLAPPGTSGQRGRLLFFGLIMFLDFAAISSLAGVYGPFTRISLGINLARTTLVLLPAGAAAAVSLYWMSKYSRPQRRLREMSVLYLLAGAGALGLAVSPTPWAALFVAIALGAGLGGIGPIVAATVVDLSGTSNRGAIVGSLLAIEGLGSVAGPLTVGLVTDLLNPRAGMAAIGAIFVALVAVTASGVRREWRDEPRQPGLAP